MPQVINTNMMSINSQRALNRSQMSMQTSLERLSSGLRINRAKDDAAGLAIAERITSQVRGLDMAIRNANDGVSMLQTAEGALEEVTNALHRMRELSVQAANGTYNSSDRSSLNDEFTALAAEITRIAQVTEFNNSNLLNSGTAITFQVGWEAGSANQINVSLGLITALSGISGTLAGSIARPSGALSMLSAVSVAVDKVTELRADFGALQNRLESSVRNMENVIENQSSARSRIQDADFARETANLTRTQILQQAGTAMLAQANQLPQNVLSLLQG